MSEPDTAPRPPGISYIRSRGLRIPRDPLLTRRLRQALRNEEYEAREAEAVQSIVAPEDTVLELGAGIGYMSTLAARRARRVHAFEANPNLIPFIRQVHAANGADNATVHNAMVGPEAGTATFYVRKNILASSLSIIDPDAPPPPSVEIEVRDAGTVMAELAPTVLICDIEGAEKDVIPAMDLSGLRAAIVELHPQWIGEAGVRAVFEAMMAAGLTYLPKRSNAKVVAFKKGW